MVMAAWRISASLSSLRDFCVLTCHRDGRCGAGAAVDQICPLEDMTGLDAQAHLPGAWLLVKPAALQRAQLM